jgi:hypothetical protein
MILRHLQTICIKTWKGKLIQNYRLQFSLLPVPDLVLGTLISQYIRIQCIILDP